MAYQLAAWIQCNSQDQALLIKQLLDRETRPCFVEDVPKQHHSLFERLSDVEFPVESETHQDQLWLFWYEVENFGFKEITVLLHQIEVTALFIFEVPEYPMSGDLDQDESSGRFWIFESGTFQEVNRKVISARFPEKIVKRLPHL